MHAPPKPGVFDNHEKPLIDKLKGNRPQLGQELKFMPLSPEMPPCKKDEFELTGCDAILVFAGRVSLLMLLLRQSIKSSIVQEDGLLTA